MFWKLVKIGGCGVSDFAAAELKKYLTMIDSEFEYVMMSFEKYDPLVKDALWIGIDEQFPLPEVEDKSLDDAISVCVHGHSGHISGTNPRSVLIAVYRFLRELGCAFIRPGTDGEVIPKRSLANVEVSVFEAASYRHRGICIEGSVSAEHVLRNIDWLPKVGMNSFFNQFQIPFTFYDRWYSHRNNPLCKTEEFSIKDAEGIANASVEEIKHRGLLYHAAGHGWTCEPFGIEGSGWDVKDYKVPEETKPYLALVNGKRELWNGIPLNTNLCYSSDYVKNVIANAVADYCTKLPQADIVHIWLADDFNNHCECKNCIDKLPADLYVELLNRVDEELTKRKIKTRIVFLVYYELLWEPMRAQLKNPSRFILMFAPITRTYTTSLADAAPFDEKQLAAYVRNKASFPKNVSENLARLFKWQRHFDGDSFIFDYHYMWDHFLDPGYYETAKILFKDMKHLDKYNINGMISCQNQRVFFPTGLGMSSMAQVLWNKSLEFNEVAKEYFQNCFGAEGLTVMEYMSTLSALFNPPYLRGECTVIDKQSAENYAKIPTVIKAFAQTARKCISESEGRIAASQIKSWKYLLPHGELCCLLAKTFEYTAQGCFEKANDAALIAMDFAREHESDLHNVFDACLFIETLEKTMNTLFTKD